MLFLFGLLFELLFLFIFCCCYCCSFVLSFTHSGSLVLCCSVIYRRTMIIAWLQNLLGFWHACENLALLADISQGICVSQLLSTWFSFHFAATNLLPSHLAPIAQPKRLMLWTLFYFREQATNKNPAVKKLTNTFWCIACSSFLCSPNSNIVCSMIGFTLRKKNRKVYFESEMFTTRNEVHTVLTKILRLIYLEREGESWTVFEMARVHWTLHLTSYDVCIGKFMQNNQGQQRNNEPTNNNRRMKMPHSREWSKWPRVSGDKSLCNAEIG